MSLQPMTPADCRTLAGWLADPELLAMTAPDWTHPISSGDIERAYLGDARGFEALKAVVDGRMVGHLGLRVTGGVGHLFHVVVDPGERRKGYGLAMTKAAVERAFLFHGVHRVSLHVFDDNGPAVACYTGAGFRIEGRHRDMYRSTLDGRWRSAYTMAILRPEWEESESRSWS
jgi:RimJ/RimL family protein N-acetyltransferase